MTQVDVVCSVNAGPKEGWRDGKDCVVAGIGAGNQENRNTTIG